MGKHSPIAPPPMETGNGEQYRSAFWEMLMHINGRIDRLYIVLGGAGFLVALALIGIIGAIIQTRP